MTAHAEYPLRGARISEVLNLSLAVATPKACAAECLVPGENGKILDLVSTGIAAVRAVVAYQRAVTE